MTKWHDGKGQKKNSKREGDNLDDQLYRTTSVANPTECIPCQCNNLLLLFNNAKTAWLKLAQFTMRKDE